MGLKEQITNRKAQISKKLTLVRNLNKPGADDDRLWRLLGEAESKMDEMMDIFDDVIEMQELEGDIKTFKEAKIKATDEYASKISEVAELLMSRTSPTRTMPTVSPLLTSTERHHFKPITDMKPFLLSTESEPFEMRVWIGKFRAYYKASHVEVLDLEGQKSLLKNFLHNDLCVAIDQELENATSIEACYLVIEEHFMELKPLFTRRLALFRMKKDGRTFKDFSADLRRRAREAELSSITPAQLIIFLALAGCRDDPPLFAKLREMKDPDLNDLTCKAALHEGMMKDSLSLDSPSTGTLMQVEATPSAEAILAAIAVNCKGCGYPHTRERCPFRDRPCFACGKVGHIKNLCRHRSSSGASTSRGRPQERGRRGSPAMKFNPESSRSPSFTRVNTVRSSDEMKLIEVTCKDKNAKEFKLRGLPDSGAARTVLPLSACPDGTSLHPSQTNLRAANGTSLRNLGKFQFVCNAEGGPLAGISAAVSPDIGNCALIGKKDLQALGILPYDFPAVHHCKQVSAVSTVTTVHNGKPSLDAVNGNIDVTIKTLSPEQIVDIEKAIKRIEGAGIKENIRKFLIDSADVMVSSLGEAAGSMSGGPMKIELNDNKDFKPYHVTTARSIPIHHEKPADDLRRELIKAQMMTRCTENTEWCAPAHFVPKANGKVRLVIDYRRLNAATKRPVHPFSSVPDLMRQILPESRWFAKLDAVHGYFQISLDEESSYLCAFLLPDGKYRPLVAPMGWKGSGDVFSLRTDLAFEELKRKKWIAKIVDDICVQAVSLPQLMDRLIIVIQKCREHGIKLSINKFEIGQTVMFAGFMVSSEGMKPDPSKLAALRSFPRPKSVTDLRSFLGLANQLGAFLPDLQHATVKIRELLKKSAAWLWLPEHEARVVKPFDPNLSTQLLTDASKLHGLGFALIQREHSLDGKGKIRLIQCGSCALSPAQKNYAAVELELSAIWFAVQKCRFFLHGMPKFEVITDHRPLLGIFEKPLAALNNARLQRLRENLDQFSFSVKWSAGKNHLIADALSRFPVFAADPSLDVELCAAITESNPAFHIILSNIDEEYVQLRDCIKHGHPLSKPLSPYGSVANEMRNGVEEEEGLLLVGDRIVVPRPARRAILELLHLSHSGITKSVELAKQLYYWPGMQNEVELWIRRCHQCVKHLPSQSHEPISSGINTASFPMEAVSVDLFETKGKHFLVMVDRFSGFPFISMMRLTTTEAVWNKLRGWFNDFGFPRHLKSDGGPQFRQRFAELCAEFGIVFETSSPYNPRSNGLAEAAVKSVKTLLKKHGGVDGADFRAALLEWRATPRSDGFAPAMGFFGRNLRTQLPSVRSLNFQLDQTLVFKAARRTADDRHVQEAAGKTLSTLNIGDVVHVQHPIDKEWSFGTGEVIQKSKSGRSYVIQTAAGQFVRNRRFLKPAPVKPVSTPTLRPIVSATKTKKRRNARNLKVRFNL